MDRLMGDLPVGHYHMHGATEGWGMVASDGYAEFLREQLAPLGRVTMRRMFGKTGVFCDGVMLGMVTENTLYFRVDETSPFGARRSDCSTNPMSLSHGRARRWRRRAALRRSENGRRQTENQSLNQREECPRVGG